MSAAPASALPHDLAGWKTLYLRSAVPVLAATAEALEEMRVNEDAVDANMLGEMSAGDPLMTLKVLVHAATHRSRRVVTDVQSVTAAALLMGISPFFRAFGPQPTVDAVLAGQDDALDAVRALVQRSYRAARFALAFAVHRNDHDAVLIYQAALMNDVVEILLWCHAPDAARRIAEAQRAQPTLRSTAAQQQILGVELRTIQREMMLAWQLPELMTRMVDDREMRHHGTAAVALAVRVARHSSADWNNAALPDDVREIASLLKLTEAAVLELMHDIES